MLYRECVAFQLLRKTSAGSGESERLRQQGVLHLRRVRKLCEIQLSAGRLFVNILSDTVGGHGKTVHADLLAVCRCLRSSR